MPLTLVATPGSADANAYVTLAEAEAYVETLVFSEDWSEKSNDQKNAAIVTGARLLDTLRWRGCRAVEAQAMAWPRRDADGWMLLDDDGYAISSETIPAQIKTANCELAMRLLGEDRAADAGALAPASLSIGSLKVDNVRAQIIPAYIRRLTRTLLASAGTVHAERG